MSTTRKRPPSKRRSGVTHEQVEMVTRAFQAAARFNTIDFGPILAKASKQAAESARLIAVAMNSPRMKRFQEQWDRALKGDHDALIDVIDDSGIEVLDDEDIKRQIYLLDPADSTERKILDRIVSSLRRYLMPPRKRGRRPHTSMEAIKLVPVVQRAFDACPLHLKRRYRNTAARDLDVREISEHVARTVPQHWQAAIRKAIAVVLATKPGVSKSFGVDVVAKALSRSSGWIRSTRKRKQL